MRYRILMRRNGPDGYYNTFASMVDLGNGWLWRKNRQGCDEDGYYHSFYEAKQRLPQGTTTFAYRIIDDEGKEHVHQAQTAGFKTTYARDRVYQRNFGIPALAFQITLRQ